MLERFLRQKAASKESASNETIVITRLMPVEAASQTVNIVAVERAVSAYTDFLKIRSFDGGHPHDNPLLAEKIDAIYAALRQNGIELEETQLYGVDNTLNAFVSAFGKALEPIDVGESSSSLAA